MAMPVLTTADVRAMVLEGINLSKGAAYGTHDGSPLYKPEFVNDCIFQADIEVVKWICRTPGHPRRNEYSAALATITTPGVRVPLRDTHAHFGEVVAVDIVRNDAKVVVGKTAPAAKITEWLLDKASYGGDDCIDGYYDVVDNDFIYTGDDAIVRVLNIPAHVVSPPDANLFAPHEYKMAVFHVAMRELLRKDPGMSAKAAEYGVEAANDMSEIMGKSIMPSVEGYQQAR
jgi:hypothetical protein